MKKLFLAVALVVAFAAPAMAEQFPNNYATELRRHGPLGTIRGPVRDHIRLPTGARFSKAGVRILVSDTACDALQEVHDEWSCDISYAAGSRTSF